MQQIKWGYKPMEYAMVTPVVTYDDVKEHQPKYDKLMQ